VKIREGIGRSLYQLLKLFTYDRTSEIHLMAVLCVAAERGGLIKKKEKESSWVKLKAFLTNVGRPNKENCTDCLTRLKSNRCPFILVIFCVESPRRSPPAAWYLKAAASLVTVSIGYCWDGTVILCRHGEWTAGERGTTVK